VHMTRVRRTSVSYADGAPDSTQAAGSAAAVVAAGCAVLRDDRRGGAGVVGRRDDGDRVPGVASDRVARGVLAGKLSQVQEHDNEKDVRSAGQRRSDTEHENASKARRLMQRNPAGGDVVAA